MDRAALAEEMRKPRGNSGQRGEYVGLRLAGSKANPTMTLTVPSRFAAQLADAFEQNVQYECSVGKDGVIKYKPVGRLMLVP